MRRPGLSQLSIAVLSLLLLAPEGSRSFSPWSPLHRRQSSTRSKQSASVGISLPTDDAPLNDKAIEKSDDDPKVGVLLLNLGGPETGEDVEGFLFNLFADPDIIRLPGFLSPLQTVIATFISKRRAPKSRAAYESIGGGSPILKYSNAQAKLISESLAQRHGMQVSTYIGMRYWHPFTEDALKQIQRDAIDALVIVPLYPQFSISTSGSSLRVLQEEFSKDDSHKYGDMVHTVVSSWYDRPGYVTAMAQLIEKELQSFTDEQIQHAQSTAPNLEPLHILFSAHGVPQSYIEAGDPYQTQIEACVERITNAITHPNVKVHLSYQSRVGPIEWLRPYTDDVLPELANSGVRNLVVVPISFVSEHIETLEEIDIEYRELAEESGITNWRRCPALNTDERFIDDMADMVMDALQEPAQTVTEACVANNVGDVELQPLDERVGISTVGVGGVGASISSDGSDEELALLKEPERLLARIAIAGIFITFLVELFSGSSMVDLFFR